MRDEKGLLRSPAPGAQNGVRASPVGPKNFPQTHQPLLLTQVVQARPIQRVGAREAMTWDPNAYVKLLLNREAGTRDKYLIALRTTADYYGWTEDFPIWTPKTVAVSGGYELCVDPGRRGRMFCEAGIRLRVCRSPSTAGNPRGMTNAFKVSTNCGKWDIAEVAHFTQGDWYWMTGPHGERIERARWEAHYQECNPRERGGLVSA